MTQLRDYQLDDVAKLRDAFRQHRRVLYCLPTGGGKTVVFAWISEAVAAKGKRVLILEHRRELVAQASAKLTDAGVPHGIIDAGLQGVSRHPVNVASVMTLRRRLDHYRDFPPDLVVVDEAHHAVAGSWDEILATFPLARILGVTATPERLDGKGLMTHFDTLVLGPTVRELIEAGYLANYIAYRRPGRALDLSGVRTIGGDYDQRQLSKLMSNAKLVGDALEHYGRHAGGKPAIAFCCTVDHAEAVAETFRAEGLRAYSVDGTMGGDERAARIGGLADGRTEVLTSCMLVSEGLDIPGVGAAILLRPTQSLALYLQQVGRTLRPKKDGGDAILLDHAGLMDRHGMPCDERGWRLEGRPKGKKKTAAECPVQTCFSCYATVAAAQAVCPHCGAILKKAKPLPEVGAGDLVATRPRWIGGDGKPLVNKNRDEIDEAVLRCTDYQDLQELGRALAFKSGWAINVAHALGWTPKLTAKGFPYHFTPVAGWQAKLSSERNLAFEPYGGLPPVRAGGPPPPEHPPVRQPTFELAPLRDNVTQGPWGRR